MVHPNAILCSFKILNNLLFCILSREDEMIIDIVFSCPKNACFKVSYNGLSSCFGSDSDNRLSFFQDGASYYILPFHLLVSIGSDESSKVLTSSTSLSI